MQGIDPQLRGLLIGVQRRFRSVQLAWMLVFFWLAIAIAVQVGWLPEPRWSMSRLIEHRVSILIACALGGMLWGVTRWTHRDLGELARRIEEQHPSLQQRLLTAIGNRSENASPYLHRRLIEETVQHGQNHDWSEAMPKSRFRLAWGMQWIALVGLAAWVLTGGVNRSGVDSAMALVDGSERMGWSIEPGDIELERGSDLLITARFNEAIPERAQLILQAASGGTDTVEMVRALSDPLFGATARRVDASCRYAIRAGGVTSDFYRVTVFEHPELLQSDATIVSPEYANQGTRTVEDTRRVTVVEGSEVTWQCRLNKEVSSAELVDDSGGVTVLARDPIDPLLYRATFELAQSERWELRLADKESRSAKVQESLSVRVLENKEPEIKLVGPADRSVSALQEIMVTAKVKDDFGLVRTGLSYSLGGVAAKEILLGESGGHPDEAGASAAIQTGREQKQPDRKLELRHALDLEAMRAKSDQLLTYYVWTEDIDRDGQVRRTDGELFFAEVRPFEELFREGESEGQLAEPTQPNASGSSAAQQAEDLAELQKKILSGTWNVLRKGSRQRDAESLFSERDVLVESQKQALEQSNAMLDELQDEKSIQILKSLQEEMQGAIDSLQRISDAAGGPPGLRDALRAEQGAYEGLLRLRAREHSIVRQQQSSQQRSQSSSQRNRQQQIDQLKLEDNQNRFETETRPEESRELESEREMRQVMNRLDELARRQSDLNQQLRELDLALREAEAGEEKEQLEEELRRLRDQQEEMLRDADELLDRMNQEQVRESMEESSKRMEQAREQMQQSNRSLSGGEPSPAIASGAKAQAAIQETRDTLREKSSDGLRRSMDALRQQATELEERQSELDRDVVDRTQADVAAADVEATSTLRTAAELRSESSDAKSWQEQQERFNRLLDGLQETVKDSEASEPVLADELYETFRQAKQRGIDQRFEQVPKLLERGLDASAQEASGEVLEAIRGMREQIEKSASSVLGSDEKAMQRAIRELDQARAWLEEERQAMDPESRTRNGEPGQGRGDAMEDSSDGGGEQAVSGSSGLAKEDSSDLSARPESGRESSKQPAGGEGEHSSEDSGANGEDVRRGSEPGNPSGRSGMQGEGSAPSERRGGRGGDEMSSQQQNASDNAQPDGRGGQGGVGVQRDAQGAEVGSGREKGRVGMEQLAGEREFVAPLTGEDFSRWSDALRDVEELVRDPEWKAEAARIREAAREMRIETKRHARDPQWPLVQRMLIVPMDQLRQKVSEELIRKSAKQNEIVPIDRDPVPNQYQERLDRYYENLGSGKNR